MTRPDPSTTAPAGEEIPLPRSRLSAWFPCLYLVFLAFPLAVAWSRGGAERIVGAITVAFFVAWYATGMVSPWPNRDADDRRSRAGAWVFVAVLVVASTVLGGAAGWTGFGTGLTFVACGGAAVLPRRSGLAVVLAAGAALAAATAVLGGQALVGLGFGVWIVVVGMSVWSSVEFGRQRAAVTRAREERAAMAVDLERSRLARDLHDILGHSLTVVTVKAELAQRLVDADPARAKAEMAEVERLARDALADVRSTVSNYRTLSLPAELAGARRALEAAGIRAEVPGAADEVPSELRDLFAWVVREGVTNVVRHSGAHTCAITLTPTAVEVCDDGRGLTRPAAGTPGNGLVGLAERARLAGARLETPDTARGFVLRAVRSEEGRTR